MDRTAKELWAELDEALDRGVADVAAGRFLELEEAFRLLRLALFGNDAAPPAEDSDQLA
ncbi:MAG: hypothetical protein JWL86_6785 [Rhizobium sp.]|nr:hypothetical protein [Rhizobium sp.]